MSMKYIEEKSRSGICYKKFNSAFGSKILAKFGWKEGEGLGKKKDGIVEAIQIKRRDENLGLGKENEKSKLPANWWNDDYNKLLSKMKSLKSQNKVNEIDSDDEDINKLGLNKKPRKNSNISNHSYSLRKRSDVSYGLAKRERKKSNISNISRGSINSKKSKISQRKKSINNQLKKDNTNDNKNNKTNKKNKEFTKEVVMLKKKRRITFLDI